MWKFKIIYQHVILDYLKKKKKKQHVIIDTQFQLQTQKKHVILDSPCHLHTLIKHHQILLGNL
jgi:hypothetical protein